MLTGEQIERLEALLAKATSPCSLYTHDDALLAECKSALPALLQLARAVNEAPRREVRECCGHLLVGNEWDEADAAIDAMRGQTVALVPVPVKEGA